MRRKKIKYILMLCLTAILLTVIPLACGDISIDLTVDSHLCYYGYESIGIEYHNSSNNEFNVESKKWAENQATPTVYVYHLLSNFDDSRVESFTIGENVYVGICCFQYNYTASESKCTVKGTNGGFFVYDCTRHGCFNSCEDAIPLSKGYLDFVSAVAKAKGTVFNLAKGSYYYGEAFDLKSYLTAGYVKFANPQETTVCLGSADSSLVAESISYLTSLEIDVYTGGCFEPEDTSLLHRDCNYFSLLGGMVPQDSILAASQSLLNNYMYLYPEESGGIAQNVLAYLVDDIEFDGVLKIADGYFGVICTNGYTFKGETSPNVLIVDCTEHICLADELAEYFPVSQEFLVFAATAFASAGQFVVPQGNYALMEDVDFTSSNIVFAEGVEYNICLNGHKITGTELPESATITDCTRIEETVSDVKIHTCKHVAPHSCAILVGQSNVNSFNPFDFKGYDVTFALSQDITVSEIIVIPSNTKVTICLNGYEIVGRQSSIPHIFKVNYGAELTICDCSAENTGKVILKMSEEDADLGLDVNDGNIQKESGLESSQTQKNERVFGTEHIEFGNCCVYNVGTLRVKGAHLYGSTGVYNGGKLHANGGSINGYVTGILQAPGDGEYSPLRSSILRTNLNNCEVSSFFFATLIASGESEFYNVDVYTTMYGVISLSPSPCVVEDVGIYVTVRTDLIETLFDEELEIEDLSSFAYETYCGFAAVNLNIEGEVYFEIEEELIAPFEKTDSEGNVTVVTPIYVQVAIEGGRLNISPWVEFEKPLEVGVDVTGDTDEYVLSNTDISGKIAPIEGYTLCVNDFGQTVILDNDALGFMNNAKVKDLYVDETGYVSIGFECLFDVDENSESFLKNGLSAVIVTDGVEIETRVSPNQGFTENGYFFTITVAPMDYKKVFDIKFSNGTYTWVGLTGVSLESYLYYIIEEATVIDLEGEVDSEAALLRTAAAATLNYCISTAYHFGVSEDCSFVDYKVSIAGLEDVSILEAMESVTAEAIKDYKAVVKEGSKLPTGVKIAGTSLILDYATSVRMYFVINPTVKDNISVTIDGEEYILNEYESVTNGYYLELSNIASYDLFKAYTIEITDGTDTYSVNYGAMSYVYTSLSRGNASESTLLMMKALTVYAFASSEYELYLNEERGAQDEEI